MRQKTTALALLLAMAFVPACGVFEKKTELVWIREDLTLGGAPRQIIKTTHPVKADIAFTRDGATWEVSRDQTIPAGWPIVSPAILKEPKEGEGVENGTE